MSTSRERNIYTMERRGGCCIERYTGGSVDRIMMKFRPIAPKPTSGESVSPPGSVSDPVVPTKRRKRRYTTKNGGSTGKYSKRKRKATSSPEQKPSENTTGSSVSFAGEITESIVTLPLLPVEHVRVSTVSNPTFPQDPEVSPPWLWRRKAVAESWVTVECVTETWVEGTVGCTDEERRMSLERDTCPGFGSDGAGRVTWTNEAYGKMVGQGEDVEVVVWLAMGKKVREILMYLPAFACRVRMQNRCGKEMRSWTLPCDAWRMDGGGFAWKLDVKAALTLCLSL